MHSLEQLRKGELNGATHVKLSCGLQTFPVELYELSDTLEILDLSNNKLRALPDDLDRFKKLKIAFFSDNEFETLPEVLGSCPSLEMIGFKSNKIEKVPEISLPVQTRWLILTNNRIERLPGSIGNCDRLQKTALAGNCLKSLPDEMANCRNLELLRISANQLPQFPEWLLSLPKLAWLAFAGNPFSERFKHEHNLPEINWYDLELKEKLGEGASGHIYKANYKGKETALKLFKGEVTSDGYPQDEMQACIAAGEHEHLVKLKAQLVHHPENKHGLVFELIPPHYFNLGNPPDFSTCSRDTFKQGTTFTTAQVYKITKATAQVALHLHNRGISHGDLYAHNMLIDDYAHLIFGDYGAASAYNRTSEYGKFIEKIEVRAFGCLMDDLLALVSDTSKPLYHALCVLRNECMNETVESRPLFDTICRWFENIQL